MKRLSLLLLLLAACHRKPSDSLAYLGQYAGQTPTAAGIWTTEPLHTQLKEMTGDRYDQFVKYMGNAGPLTQDDYLYALAPIAHDSTRGYAFILIDTKTNKIEASMHTTFAIENFQSPGEAFTLPAPIQSRLDSLK
jgi:hypothetical protein